MSHDRAEVDVLVVGAGTAGLAAASAAAGEGADAGGVFHARSGGGLGMSLVLRQPAARTAMAGIRARRDVAPFSR